MYAVLNRNEKFRAILKSGVTLNLFERVLVDATTFCCQQQQQSPDASTSAQVPRLVARNNDLLLTP